jgi:hypothetical protein
LAGRDFLGRQETHTLLSQEALNPRHTYKIKFTGHNLPCERLMDGKAGNPQIYHIGTRRISVVNGVIGYAGGHRAADICRRACQIVSGFRALFSRLPEFGHTTGIGGSGHRTCLTRIAITNCE